MFNKNIFHWLQLVQFPFQCEVSAQLIDLTQINPLHNLPVKKTSLIIPAFDFQGCDCKISKGGFFQVTEISCCPVLEANVKFRFQEHRAAVKHAGKSPSFTLSCSQCVTFALQFPTSSSLITRLLLRSLCLYVEIAPLSLCPLIKKAVRQREGPPSWPASWSLDHCL